MARFEAGRKPSPLQAGVCQPRHIVYQKGAPFTVARQYPMTDTQADFLIEQRGTALWFIFNRPQTRNALTYEMYDALAETCRTVADDGSVSAIVVTGADEKSFAAGTDISLFKAFTTPQHGLDYEARMEAVFTEIEICKVPTIAAISGACTGGGLAIAVACDLRIAASRSKFGVPIVRTLGNCLSTENLARTTALIGEARVREMLLLARLFDADEALSVALVSEVLDDRDLLLARAQELAEQLAEHAPITMRATKEGLRRLRKGNFECDDLIASTYGSADFKEGMSAFLEKRKPQWTGQ
jgi:enoyl-CoA hydratase